MIEDRKQESNGVDQMFNTSDLQFTAWDGGGVVMKDCKHEEEGNNH